MASDSAVWERYTFLAAELRHQDEQINKMLTWNAVAQGALLSSLGLNFVTTSILLGFVIPLLGMVLAVLWYVSGLRLQSYTHFYDKALRSLENSETSLSDFKTFNGRYGATRRGMSKVSYLFIIPCLLGVVWIAVLAEAICKALNCN